MPRYAKPRVEELESRLLLKSPFEAPSLGAPPPPGPAVIWVDTVAELQSAFANAQSNQTIVIQRGTYQLDRTLFLGNGRQVSNVTIRGETDNFDDVVIRGRGMENAAYGQTPHGISIYNAQDVTIANLSIGDVYYHPIDLQGVQGADRVRLYHLRVFDGGEQLIKSSAGGGGVDDVTLEYSLIEYTGALPSTDHGGGIGYTGALHAHEADRWIIRHNLVRNFHTPDSSAFWYNPAVLMWNYSRDTIVEGNTFINCDRAVALGLDDKPGNDHEGGVVRNNFIYLQPGLFSSARRAGADTQIAVYDSPNTKVVNNTVLVNGNTPKSIEVRWANAGVEFRNNLADAVLGSRNGGTFSASGNYLSANSTMFANAAAGDLHLVSNSATLANVIDRVSIALGTSQDWDGDARPGGSNVDIGADEFRSRRRNQVTLQNAVDNHLTSLQNLNANLGGSRELQFFKAGGVYRPLIQFDLSAIPSGSNVTEARLELHHLAGGFENAPMGVSVYALAAPWVEGNGTNHFAAGTDSSWLQAGNGRFWNNPGGDFNTTFNFGNGANGVIASATIPRFSARSWLSFDITAAVQAWVRGQLPNYGVAFVITSGDYTEHAIASSEYGDSALAPRLAVAYEDELAPPPAVTELTLTPGDRQIRAAWTLPADPSVDGVRLVRRTDRFPTAVDDGIVAFEGGGVQFTDVNLVNGQTYYYKAFSYDDAPGGRRYADALTSPQASAVPRAAAVSTVTLQNAVDNHLTSVQNLAANLGGSTELQFFKAGGGVYRPLLRFDLASMPQGATITDARLELYHLAGGFENAPMGVNLFTVSRAWNEGSSTNHHAPGAGSSWLNADTGVAWTTPGGDFNLSQDFGHGANGLITSGLLPRFTMQAWVGFDVTRAVQAWTSGQLANHGFAFVITSGDHTEHQFASSEYGNALLAPRLVITYRQ